jgi:outer membrane protein OmpA-like peptidoglycan-associated protein
MTRASWPLLIVTLVTAHAVAQPEHPRQVPLTPGLTVVTALHHAGIGDYESVKQITFVDTGIIRLTYAADIFDGGVEGLFGASQSSGKVRQARSRRTVRRQDLQDAREYMQLFSDRLPGTTALGVSTVVLHDLKTKGRSPLTMRSGGLGASLGGLIGAIGGADFSKMKEIRDLEDIDKVSGTIRRVEPAPVPFRVLVNDRTVELPAVHARGRLGEEDGEFYFLDDERNPLALKWVLGEESLQVIKIRYPEGDAGAGGAARIASALAEKRRVEIYGIYFDFDSDVLRPESEGVLREIAQALGAHPEWKLRVEGHTDNIGTDAHNLDLSKRRAAAVKTALATRYNVASARLSTGGYGASRPKDTNDTVEGRARNRRVELVRQ